MNTILDKSEVYLTALNFGFAIDEKALTAIIVVSAAVVFLALLYLFLSFAAFRFILKSNRKKQERGDHFAVFGEEFVKCVMTGKEWFFKQPYEVFEMESSDKLILKGFWLKTPFAHAKATAVLVHGYNGTPFERMFDAKMYIENGYNVFIPFLRGHGESQGKYIGMGNLDSRDILLWIYFLIERLPVGSEFVLSGNSMGAATVATLTGNPNLPDVVKAAVCDSGFTSVSDEVNFLLGKFGKGLRRQVEKSVEGWAKLLLKYDFKRNSPLENVAKSKTPTFFMHGDIDSVVSVEMTKRLFETCSAPKELMIIKGAGHCLGYVLETDNVTNRVLSFFDKYLNYNRREK